MRMAGDGDDDATECSLSLSILPPPNFNVDYTDLCTTNIIVCRTSMSPPPPSPNLNVEQTNMCKAIMCAASLHPPMPLMSMLRNNQNDIKIQISCSYARVHGHPPTLKFGADILQHWNVGRGVEGGRGREAMREGGGRQPQCREIPSFIHVYIPT